MPAPDLDDRTKAAAAARFIRSRVQGDVIRGRGQGDVVLDQARLRGANRKFGVGAIDLGNEPPLSVDGGSGSLVDRRRFSLQWFSGTILTGLCGAALMGGAVFASLDGETNFAAAPERVETALRGALNSIGEHLTGFRKTDRLAPITEPSVARHALRIPTSTRVRERELVRTRNFVRVSGNLSLSVSDISANIPPFNPQKLLTEGVASADDTPGAEPDAEVSFVTCDFFSAGARGRAGPANCELGSLLPKVKASTQLPLDEVITRVRDIASHAGTGSMLLANADPTPTGSIKLSYAAEGDTDLYVGFEARVVPENITLLPKTTTASEWSERAIVAKKGDTVGSILRELGATIDEIRAINAAFGARAREGGLKEGQRLRILTASAGLGHTQPLRVIIASESAIEAAVALSDKNQYVALDVRNIARDLAEESESDSSEDDGSGVRLYQSIYETALRNNVPKSVIEEFVRVYSYDVDFQRKVQSGDSFDVLYAEDESGEGRNEVRYASLTVGGDTKKYYRYQTTDDGAYDYYDDTGKSAKKFLVRKPVAVGLMRSGFGERHHPLLRYMKMHTGVDWAAPYGTPIFAAGNGAIDEIGVKGGYGKYVRIRHANGYQTAYGHMTAFARGLTAGSKVRQGQVIGFVGSTGLSTGAHVHYEILINDRFVDPMKVKLPRGRVLEGSTLALFEKDREQLDTLMARAHIAQAH
jgi:murein DD-endopeptidase MepM/ murein hydrolase activator NlpD